MSPLTFRPGFNRRSGVLALLWICAVAGGEIQAAPKIAAKAVFKNGTLNYSGTLAGPEARAGMPVSVYDAGTGILLHALRTDFKKKFQYALPIDKAPCNIRLEVSNGSSIIKVTGAAKACATELSCNLSAAKTPVQADEPVRFTALTRFSGKKVLPTVSWDFGDGKQTAGATDKKGQSSEATSYKNAGRYAVSYTAVLNGKQCQDRVIVSVAPHVPTLPASVTPIAATPGTASGMSGEYVAIPFNEKSEPGVSAMSYDAYIQTQSLNALVYKKDPKKPGMQSPAQLDVFYSAALNPLDPVGSDSINSTSQNWFADGSAGANFDSNLPDAFNKDNNKRKNQSILLAGKSFEEDQPDGVKKTGFYDRLKNRDNNGGSRATSLTSGPAATLTNLDEGARASNDSLAEVRAMPGKNSPYRGQEEQQIKAAAGDGSFSAQMLPITGVDDKGRKNPFPLMRVVAKQGGQALAATDAVVTSSNEMSCAACHTKGKISGNDEVWRTPVTVTDPEAKGDGSAHPAGSGSIYPGSHESIWAPALQNRFELKIVSTDSAGKNTYQMVNPLNPAAANLRAGAGFDQEAAFQPILVKNPDGSDFISNITNKPMILRGDRVKAYRIQDGKLQIQLKFVAPANDSAQAKEAAALLNMSILHDYYDSFGPTNPAEGKPKDYSTLFADNLQDKSAATTVNPPSCGGHHFSNNTHDVGRSSIYNARFVYSNYSRTMHGFHGRLQVYKEPVSAAAAPDGLAHAKGELIRDSRGHHIPFGGAGWDPEHKDDFKTDTASSYDGTRNNFAPELVPLHPKGELLIPFDLKRGSTGEILPVNTANKSVDLTENCSICHAGKTEQVYHDVHFSAGLKCENCHGDMQAVGSLWPLAGKSLTDKHAFRVFHYDQPDCASCHFGANPAAARNAFERSDKAATPKQVARNTIDQRFAVIPATLTVKRVGLSRAADKICFGTEECNDVPVGGDSGGHGGSANGELDNVTANPLFRKSADMHGNVPCAACHGSTHTTWPITDPSANDNVTAKQLQGYDGTLMECDVCHSKERNQNSFADGMLANNQAIAYGKRGTLVSAADPQGYLAGPHGMHPVNDPNWYSDAPLDPNKTPGGWHSVSAKIPGPNGEDQCAACHGKSHKAANRLAKTQIKRVFANMTVEKKKKTVTVQAGQAVSCTACHSQKISFRGTPWEREFRSFR